MTSTSSEKFNKENLLETCTNYQEMIGSIETFLEDNELDKDSYIVDIIAGDVYETDGLDFIIIAGDEEIAESLEINKVI